MAYQIPMIEVAITLALSGAEPNQYSLYMAPYSDRREGPESLADYLNGRRRFFPMLSEGVLKLINRDQILWVRHEKPQEDVDPDAALAENLTILELVDGTRIEGVIPIDRPREQSRVSDVLNDPTELFFRIDAETEAYYVNKQFVRSVIPR